MELNLQRQSITINNVVYDGSVEQPIECDAQLPEYCPDLVKALKCAVTTHIGSTEISGELLTIDGMAVARVYYSAEGGGIRQAEYKIPFERVVELRSAPVHPVVTVKPKLDYVNCRPVNQRRVDIRGAITLAVKVTDSREEEVISDAEGGGLQLRREMVQATDLTGRYETAFPVEEDLELGYGKPAINAVLRADARVNVTDCKVVAGKVVAKGDFLLHLCYQSMDSENKLETMEYSLPVSQIIDAEGADEDSVCDVSMAVVSCDVSPKQDGEGEYRIFALDASVQAVVTVYRHKEVPVASDCYSTQYESRCKQKPASFLKLIEVVKETVPHKASLDLPEGVESVLDAWCEVEELEWKREGGELRLTLRLNVNLFARMEDGETTFFDQPSDAERTIQIPGGCGQVFFEPSADVLTSDYSLSGKERIDIRCEVCVRGCVMCQTECSSIGEIEVDEEAPKPKAKNKLCLYFADAGESLWDIAKRYNTSADAIWEENSVTEDILPAKATLLIPII